MDSRLGRRPIPVPAAVDITQTASQIVFKGPKGSLEIKFPEDIAIEFNQDERLIKVNRSFDTIKSKALQGTFSSLVKNAIKGVEHNFEVKLLLVGTGYRINLISPIKLKLLLGFSHDVFFDAPNGVEFEAPNSTELIVRGVDKHLVGQTAANIFRLRPVEPYKGKGFRYDGVQIELKEVNKK